MLYQKAEVQYIREFVDEVARFPNKYRPMDHDNTLRLPVMAGPDLTKGYVKALADLKSGRDVADNPILMVYTRTTNYRDDTAHAESDKQRIKMTEMKLVDGDGHQIFCRLALHLADAGRALNRGDKIRLVMFTPLTHQYKGNPEWPERTLPALFICQMSLVGQMSALDMDSMVKEDIPYCRSTNTDVDGVVTASDRWLLPSEKPAAVVLGGGTSLETTAALHDSSSAASSGTTSYAAAGSAPVLDPLNPLTMRTPVCTHSNRLCACHGIRFIGCVCDVLPVNQRTLTTIKEDCYFATTDLEDMPNNQKRNMLYWWYAVNVFNISGAGKRGKLPECLEYEIRKLYPNEDGVLYTGYHR